MHPLRQQQTISIKTYPEKRESRLCCYGFPLKPSLIKEIMIVFSLVTIITAMNLLMPCKISAGTVIEDDPAQTKETMRLDERAAGHEQTARFYRAVESLIDAYGEDHFLWPDNEDKRLIEKFLKEKDALTLKNCVFGRNLLGLGLGETSKDAEEALSQKATDAWGNPYSLIMAGSNHSPKAFEMLFAIGVNRGVPLFNRDICAKVFVFLKADLHSLFADVFKNFNGETVLIMAREVHIIGAPGSAEPAYGEKLNPALCAADNLNTTVYIGENDPVTTIIPRSFRDKMYSMYSFFGLVFPEYKGKERQSDECLNKKPPIVKVFHLKACGHDMPEYYPGMRKYGTTMLKGRSTGPDNLLNKHGSS